MAEARAWAAADFDGFCSAICWGSPAALVVASAAVVSAAEMVVLEVAVSEAVMMTVGSAADLAAAQRVGAPAAVGDSCAKPLDRYPARVPGKQAGTECASRR